MGENPVGAAFDVEAKKILKKVSLDFFRALCYTA
jgi:hypothetical protein